VNTWRAGYGANSYVRFGGRCEETGGLKGPYRASHRPYYNVLEDTGMNVLVANARHIKAVPGRKTDVKDAEWLADLLRHGLIRGSAIPSRGRRELRELVRYRLSLSRQRAQVAHRIHKVLEGANVKLARS
jgi:transposase